MLVPAHGAWKDAVVFEGDHDVYRVVKEFVHRVLSSVREVLEQHDGHGDGKCGHAANEHFLPNDDHAYTEETRE